MNDNSVNNYYLYGHGGHTAHTIHSWHLALCTICKYCNLKPVCSLKGFEGRIRKGFLNTPQRCFVFVNKQRVPKLAKDFEYEYIARHHANILTLPVAVRYIVYSCLVFLKVAIKAIGCGLEWCMLILAVSFKDFKL